MSGYSSPEQSGSADVVFGESRLIDVIMSTGMVLKKMNDPQRSHDRLEEHRDFPVDGPIFFALSDPRTTS